MRPWAKWIAEGLVLSVLTATCLWVLGLITDSEYPAAAGLAVGLVAVVPASVSLRSRAVARAADPVLVATLSLLGLVGIVCGALLAILLLAGELPRSDAVRPFVVPLIAAIAVAALAFRVLQPAISHAATRLVYGAEAAPTDLARSFGSRMTRAIPLDELALQGAESLRAALRLRRAELWVSAGDELRPWIGDPPIEHRPIPLGGVEPAAVVQAGLIGHGWMKVWLPELLDDREDAFVRAAPMAHAGELLGLLLVERPKTTEAFTPDEERTVVELARQLGVAVHNARLDSALQASLDEVRRQAAELQASRGRIVAAGDQARRAIERNLHDGAQQHLVALAVQLKLARTMIDRDPSRAGETLDGLGAQVQDTLQELRDLAHGIYPPLLADKGLSEALESAARRSILPVTVRASDLPRYPPDAEATIYFCVLEAVQNAGKYAGEGSTVRIEVDEMDRGLMFTVADDGVGFDPGTGQMGAGFTNMLDRLGAHGGTLRVESAPGKGTRVIGLVPATSVPSESRP